MKNIKYVIIHSQGNVETGYGYYKNIEEVHEKLDRIYEQEIETVDDYVEVYQVDVDKVESENDAILEDLDICDVANESELIKEFGIVISWYWDGVAE